ncbi:MAG: hypothetical protein FVQ77_04885 [Cytophagales bacterium]|nr:hypothetical protein [Cytophagales bacterium]
MKLQNRKIRKYEKLPGWELVSVGLRDLSEERYDTVEALLVLMYSSRLKFNGIGIPGKSEDDPNVSYNMKLYRLLEKNKEDAHSKYNALQRRIISFCSTVEVLGINR